MRYIKSNAVIDDRLNTIISKIKLEYKNGNIKTQTDYAIRVKDELRSFYNELGKPSMKVNLAYDIPSQEDFVESIYTALFDIKSLMEGYKYINDSISQLSDENKDLLNAILNKASTIELNVDSIIDKDTIFSDNFTESIGEEKIDENTYKAYVDVKSKILCLPIFNSSSLDKGISSSLLNTCNGFPGNTHEVYNNINSDIKFKGENNPLLNLNNISNSIRKSDNWFEMEMITLSDDVKHDTNEIGFKYKEGMSWISEDDLLKLHIKFSLEEQSIINNIHIGGVLKISEGISNPIIRRVIISDGNTKSKVIAYNTELGDDVIFTFSPQTVKDVIFEIEQSDFSHTNVCRVYGLKNNQLRSEEASAIEHDVQFLSIESLGLKYNTKTSEIIYDSLKPINDLELATIKNEIFNKNIIDGDIIFYNDIVSAMRYSIGISSLEVKNITYREAGTYISKTHESSVPIKTITLNSEDFIPNEFKEYVPKGKSINDFIEYYISFDDENSWIRINPRHKYSEGPCSVVINSNVMIAKRASNIIYIDSLTDVYNFKIKINISRPEELAGNTPYVKNYFLTVEEEEWND